MTSQYQNGVPGRLHHHHHIRTSAVPPPPSSGTSNSRGPSVMPLVSRTGRTTPISALGSARGAPGVNTGGVPSPASAGHSQNHASLQQQHTQTQQQQHYSTLRDVQHPGHANHVANYSGANGSLGAAGAGAGAGAPPPITAMNGHNQLQPRPLTSGGPSGIGGSDTPGESHAALLQAVVERGNALNQEAAALQNYDLERRQALPSTLQKLEYETEGCCVQIGAIAWEMGDYEKARRGFEEAIVRNPYCAPALQGLARYWREKENYVKAIDYGSRSLALDETGAEGEMWSTVGHALLFVQEMQKAYSCYQQAIAKAVKKDDAKLWYGIGILYDRYGSVEHAEEAFASVLKMDPNFHKRGEVYFRLGIIYKLKGKADASLECFHYILADPPVPLKKEDLWYQIGHALEMKKDFGAAREAYERVLRTTPDHSKVLQHLGLLYLRESVPFHNPRKCADLLSASLEHGRLTSNSQDPFTWYILGRAYMQMNDYEKAYEAYQQAVYRDGKNPAYWCSIGVLYFNISQFHDALDAYTRAVRIHPFIPEIWQNLGTLYESCNDQLADATDAYQRAVQLDPGNTVLNRRMEEVRSAIMNGTEITTAAPPPLDIMPDSKSWTGIHFDQTGAKPVYLDQRSLEGSPTAPASRSPVVQHGVQLGGLAPLSQAGSRRASLTRADSPLQAMSGPAAAHAAAYRPHPLDDPARTGRHAPQPSTSSRGSAFLGQVAQERDPASANGIGRRVVSGSRPGPSYGDRPSPTQQLDGHFRGGAISPGDSPKSRHMEYAGYNQPTQSRTGYGNDRAATEAADWERRMRERGSGGDRARIPPPPTDRSASGAPLHSPTLHHPSAPYGRDYAAPPSGARTRRGDSPPGSSRLDPARATQPPYPYDYYNGSGQPPPSSAAQYDRARYGDPRYEAELQYEREMQSRRALEEDGRRRYEMDGIEAQDRRTPHGSNGSLARSMGTQPPGSGGRGKPRTSLPGMEEYPPQGSRAHPASGLHAPLQEAPKDRRTVRRGPQAPPIDPSIRRGPGGEPTPPAGRTRQFGSPPLSEEHQQMGDDSYGDDADTANALMGLAGLAGGAGGNTLKRPLSGGEELAAMKKHRYTGPGNDGPNGEA